MMTGEDMANIDVVKEFEKIEKNIARDSAQNKDITRHLRAKARLLNVCYEQLSSAIKTGKHLQIAPMYAKELAFLNNIKEIQTQINEDTAQTEAEISKIYAEMKKNGLGWILENQPENAQ